MSRKYFQNGDKEYSTYTKLSVSQAPGEGADATGGLKIDAENENSSMVTKIYQDAAVNSNLNTSDKYMLSFYAKLLVDGSERTLKLSELTNNTSQTRELVLKIIAVKDGELLKSVQKTISIPALGTIDAYLTLDLSDVTVSGYSVKGLLWDEKYGIMPVIKHLE